jgi:hypothetical protein
MKTAEADFQVGWESLWRKWSCILPAGARIVEQQSRFLLKRRSTSPK